MVRGVRACVVGVVLPELIQHTQVRKVTAACNHLTHPSQKLRSHVAHGMATLRINTRGISSWAAGAVAWATGCECLWAGWQTNKQTALCGFLCHASLHCVLVTHCTASHTSCAPWPHPGKLMLVTRTNELVCCAEVLRRRPTRGHVGTRGVRPRKETRATNLRPAL